MEVNELFKCLHVREGFKCSRGGPPSFSGYVVGRSAFSLQSSSGIPSWLHRDDGDGGGDVIYEAEQ